MFSSQVGASHAARPFPGLPNLLIQNAQKLSLGCLIAFAFLLPVAGYWASRIELGTADIQTWIPASDPTVTAYERFLGRFGDDQFVLVTWPGCDLHDPRLPLLADHFSALARTDPKLAIRSVLDSARAVEQLANPAVGIDAEEAIRRLTGIAIGYEQACFLMLRIGPEEADHRSYLVDTIRNAAKSQIGVDSQDLVIAGEPMQVAMVDRSSRKTVQFFVLPSSLCAVAAAWHCLGNLRLTLLVFAFAGVGQLIGLSLISFFLGEMSAVMIVLPTLVFMLTLSAAIHLANYYLDSGGHASPTAGLGALVKGVRPCILATLTTVFGFGSLVVSHLAPIRHFGAIAAAGLIVSTAILICAFPAATRVRFGRMEHDRKRIRLSSHQPRWMLGLGEITRRGAIPISGLGIVLLLAALAGIPRLRSSTEFADMFPADSPSVKSLNWVREHIGPIDAMEFVMEFPDTNSDLLDRMRCLRELHRALQHSPHVDSVCSAITYLPTIPASAGIRGTVQRSILRRKLATEFPQLTDAGMLASDGTGEAWRITTKILDMHSDNYASILKSLRELCDVQRLNLQVVGQTPSAASLRPDISITGIRTVVEKAQRTLLSDLGSSFLAAFILITPVMMLIARSVPAGLVLMIPNTLPVALVFGGMGWLGIPLDVASILTASVALGIAVDDTVHFTSWFLRCRRSGQSRAEAVEAAIATCARPMWNTTLICSAAMFPFFFTDFLPTSKFALLMILILIGAILGDLLLLPALLQSPLGRGVGSCETRRGGDKETRRQGDKETRRQGGKE